MMSADGSITLAWGSGEHRFRLGIKQLRELQERVNEWRARIGAQLIGPTSLLRSLSTHDAWPDDVCQVLRLGLIGGGKTPVEAAVEVKRYAEDRPLAESVPAAQAVLLAALVGVENDQPGKPEPGEAATMTAPSPSPATMAPGPPSGGLPGRSMN